MVGLVRHNPLRALRPVNATAKQRHPTKRSYRHYSVIVQHDNVRPHIANLNNSIGQLRTALPFSFFPDFAPIDFHF